MRSLPASVRPCPLGGKPSLSPAIGLRIFRSYSAFTSSRRYSAGLSRLAVFFPRIAVIFLVRENVSDFDASFLTDQPVLISSDIKDYGRADKITG